MLRDISVRSGGFIASARNPVELGWVREHAALGVISLALDLGRAMEEAGAIVTEVLTPSSTLGGAFVGLAVLSLVALCMSSLLIRLKARQDGAQDR